MKRAICGFLMFFASVLVCFAQDEKNGGNVIIKTGTLLTAQLQSALDVQSSQSSDDFVLTLTEDITNGPLTIPRGSELLGRVVSVKQISSEDDVSEISLSFDFLKLLDDYFTFKANILSVTTGDSDTKVSKPDCSSSAVFKGATIISTKGKNLRLEPGTIFNLRVTRDVVIP